ncbi:MAG: adenosylcobinamide-GDP ribazoletransferase [Pseudotabrizicola sp.]|uniref:adenosylcobinamide-GDP ribazoletransferase n=1 Tax=Pseudotabrizicola sp. TaxID=2939647 RepID=UPI002726CFAC|nr:adenosylcobinamide-GDP ribazoletransferase [Pseudotabrizicola sp.]MDO8884733.1 adenosylcobinamide-GDP ribazoletransferase [Pseudotabrizicola sp.]MDP2082963.1 adenosylcobinamide-GDP ribazoletransferase [Pseudotabrizicola sp.]MDZ7574495.1 adenosylcobinamide-GDP ribazoletransferase [Pseudotabrizicola sp.]
MTAKPDRVVWIFADLASAFGLLSRLPLVQTAHHRPHACWAWPLVGLVVGGLAAGLGWAAINAGLPVGLAAALVLATGAMSTGALHEDGLADTADGLFGGWTRERRLEIMKDSHIGSFGTLALLLVTLAAWSALGALLQAGAYGAIVAAAALSRAPMAMIMAVMPQARASGLSHSVGRPPVWAALLATTFALLIAAPLGLMAATMAVSAAGAGLAIALLARARIGGQTGDILGASQQLANLAALAAASAIMVQ